MAPLTYSDYLGLPQLLDSRRLCLPGLRRDHHHPGHHGSVNETGDDQLETHLSPRLSSSETSEARE